ILKIRQTSDTSTGQIVNVFTNDLNRIDYLFWYFWYLFIAPIELIVVYVLLWQYVGYSCTTGLGFILVVVVFQFASAKYINKYRFATAKLTDSRVKLMSEILNAMKVIKMYAWENSFAEKISKIRV
ncbi:multidrug resistance-associated protein 4-like protein, partial [Leptotrombidium deliense]